jgi:hypothetical protein
MDYTAKVQRHKVITDAFLPFLKSSLGVDFKWTGNSLHQIRQHDSSSCGPCTISFLEQLVCKQAGLWTPQGAAGYRIGLFLKMAHYALESMVSL